MSNGALNSPVRSGNSVSWSAFARYFDLSANNNQAYQALLLDAERTFLELPLVDGPIADVGAGTGNFAILLAKLFPKRSIIHIEPDPEMLRLARFKAANIRNLKFHERSAECLEEAKQKWSAAITIHALYAMEKPELALQNIYDNLASGGFLFLCDLGKKHNSYDWAKYFFVSKYRSDGIWAAIRLMRDLSGLAKETTQITQQQNDGASWTHSLPSLALLCEDIGFEVLRREVVYRGYSHLLVCRKPGSV